MANDRVVISFGRYNPMTIGHGKLFDVMLSIAKKRGADMKIFATHTQDKKKNPLKYEDKIKFLKKSFPNYDNAIQWSESRTFFDVLEELVEGGYDEITLVVGEDRVKEFKRMVDVDKFNKDHNAYQIHKFDVVSAGDRDPDSEDAVEAMSASKLRDFAKNNDLNNFAKGVSKRLSKEDVKKLFNLIRSGLEINNSEELHMKEEYIIVNNKGEGWSNENGWVDKESADIFTDQEKLKLRLPIGGRWQKTIKEEKESVIKSIYVLNKAGEKFNLKLVKCRKKNLVVLYVDDVQIDEFPTEKEAHEYGVMLVKDEFKDPGLDPNGNKSRMWQTFRKWFHTMDDEGE